MIYQYLGRYIQRLLCAQVELRATNAPGAMRIKRLYCQRHIGVQIPLVAVLLGSAVGIITATSVTANAGTSRPRHARPDAAIAISLPRAEAAPKIRRKGILTLAGGGTAYDLDSRAANWNPSIGVAWTFQNIEYLPHWKGHIPALAIANEPLTDVLMGAWGHWTYQSCAQARYDHSLPGNPNGVTGSALDVGHGICIITQHTVKPDKKPLKTDGGHYVLLVVKARTSKTLTLEVTVWQ